MTKGQREYIRSLELPELIEPEPNGCLLACGVADSVLMGVTVWLFALPETYPPLYVLGLITLEFGMIILVGYMARLVAEEKAWRRMIAKAVDVGTFDGWSPSK